MVDGHGAKEFPQTRLLAYREPALFDRLMDLLVAATTEYLLAQAGAGAEVLMLFDSWAGVLPPALFRSYVIAPTQRIVAGLRAARPDIPVIAFPRLAGAMLAEYASSVAAQGVGLDTQRPARGARRTGCRGARGDGAAGQRRPAGAGRRRLRARPCCRRCAGAAHGRPWVFNLGHGIVPETPPEHVARLVAAVRAA